MNRKDIFNKAVTLANSEKGLSLRDYAKEIEKQLENAEEGFTVNPDGPKALNPMVAVFNGVIAAGIAAMREYGAYSRAQGLLGKDDASAFKVLDEERNHQDGSVTPGFAAQMGPGATPRPPVDDGSYTLPDEFIMMHYYLDKEIDGALDAGDDVKASNGIRKIAALAMRGSEHPRL